MEWITTIRDTFIIERNNAECIVYPLKAAIMGCFYTDMFLPQFKYPNGGSLVQCNRRPTDEFTWIPADSIEFLLPAQMENNPLDDLTSKSFTNS